MTDDTPSAVKRGMPEPEPDLSGPTMAELCRPISAKIMPRSAMAVSANGISHEQAIKFQRQGRRATR